MTKMFELTDTALDAVIGGHRCPTKPKLREKNPYETKKDENGNSAG